VIRKPAPLEEPALLEYAIRTMSGRALSVSELRNKLARRAVSPADVEKVMAKLKDAGALDDRRFAEHFASSRLENQGFGKMRVLRDLRARRVAPAVADEAIGATYSEVDETALIENYIVRKFRGKNLKVYLSEEKNLASAFRKLRGAGFSPGNSIRILKKYSQAADQLEEMDANETEE